VKIVGEAFETEFLNTGYQLVERSRIQSVVSELKFSMTGLTEEQGIQIGKMLNVDAVIFGTVTAFYRGVGDEQTTVGFSVKAVHVTNGLILWKASHTKRPGWTSRQLGQTGGDPVAYASDVAKEIVQELIAKGHVR
jgi:hypothetical protein